jgi:hypothetical protein
MPNNKSPASPGRVSLQVSTRQRSEFKHPLAVYAFDARGDLIERVEVRDGRADLTLPESKTGRMRVFIVPADEKPGTQKPSPEMMERLGAYEPVLQAGGGLLEHIDIPGIILDFWPWCFCWVRGKVVRQSDNRAVCNARVHVCEVDRIRWLILELPDIDVLRLRDDLIDIIRNPPLPLPHPIPDPGPDPFRRAAGADPAMLARPALRFGARVGPLYPPGSQAGDLLERVGLNPQPLPPREALALPAELHAALRSPSHLVVRNALAQNWKLLIPWFCYWPHWWWRLRCDEVAVLTTDMQGRFETTVFYPCAGDHPDLYFWVEYDFGSGFETIHHPAIACNTYWDYACGSQVTVRVTDPRVPGCEEEPDLPGRQVVVLSIGREVAVREVQSAGVEGLTNSGQPFGASLEPRVDFSRSELIGGGIPYYRWSYRRLSGPDGSSAVVDAASVPLNSWAVMTRNVYRHYKLGTSYPADPMGPVPVGATPNLFRIRPLLPPAGPEWVVLDESVDLATAYFDTGTLAGAPLSGSPWPDDFAAGRYELKLELFNTAGALVNWTDENIELRITQQDAPFGTGTVTTTLAPDYNRILAGAKTMGFRMVVRVDNNRCSADIQPVGGTVAPDPLCGFHNYNLPSDIAALSFIARHPNGFASYSFVTTRGADSSVALVSTSGIAGAAGNGGFLQIADFGYSKDVVISTLLGPCSNAAFSERLDVFAMATNGYGNLSGYNAADNAAFALALPCPVCEAEGGAAGDT